MSYTNEELEDFLNKPVESEADLPEDLMIEQPDGTRACMNWELRDKGYSIVPESCKEEINSDDVTAQIYGGKSLEED